MMTVEFIMALFYEVYEQIGAIPKHPVVFLSLRDEQSQGQGTRVQGQ